MKSTPIIFSGPMVRAILEGRKTETRRIIKPPPQESYAVDYNPDGSVRERRSYSWTWKPLPDRPEIDVRSLHMLARCPFGGPGDRLWVRENFQPIYAPGATREDADYETGRGYAPRYMADDGPRIEWFNETEQEVTSRITPSIFMPRWASRIDLRVVGTKLERLQDITEADAKAEGALPEFEMDASSFVKGAGLSPSTFRLGFKHLWDSVNAKRGFAWDLNSWVWVIRFEVERAPKCSTK